jgi:hypothetical protein
MISINNRSRQHGEKDGFVESQPKPRNILAKRSPFIKKAGRKQVEMIIFESRS